jgi:hypothetical protein
MENMHNRQNKRRFTVEDVLGGMICRDVDVELHDKLTLIDDGVDVSSFYKDDFRILRTLLYKDVETYKEDLTVEQIRTLLNCIDDMISDAIIAIENILWKGGEE